MCNWPHSYVWYVSFVISHMQSHVIHTCVVRHVTCRNTLQHTATHCNTLQHSATHVIHTCVARHVTCLITLQHTATHCNTLQHTATHVIHTRAVRHVLSLIHMCDMPHAYVWHASFICVTCLIHMCDMPHSWYASYTCVISLVHMCDKPHSHGWYALLRVMSDTQVLCDTWHASFRDMPCTWMSHGTHIWVICPIHMSDLIHLYITYMNESCPTHKCCATRSNAYGVAMVSRID